MPGFCRNCGTPLTPPSAFCVKCGAQTAAAPPAAVSAAVPAPVVTTSSGVSLIKVGVVVLSVLLLLGVMSAAGLYYAAHRLVKNVESVTGEGSVGNAMRTVASAAASASHEHGRKEKVKEKLDGCLLMMKDEPTEILGVEIIKTNSQPTANHDGEHCDYFAKPRSVEEDAEKTKESFKALQGTKDGPPSDKAIADMVKNYSRTMINAEGGEPYFTFTVDRDAGPAGLAGFEMGNALASAASGGKSSSGELAGLGDDASLGIGESMLCVRKGDVVIILELSQITDGKAKGIAMAKKILSRL
jgi:hypothetical protein